jgi:hypothetical protein
MRTSLRTADPDASTPNLQNRCYPDCAAPPVQVLPVRKPQRDAPSRARTAHNFDAAGGSGGELTGVKAVMKPGYNLSSVRVTECLSIAAAAHERGHLGRGFFAVALRKML